MVYEYYCKARRVIDGDSIIVSLNLGFDTQLVTQHLRLLEIDTAELRPKAGAQYPRAIKHKQYVEGWLADAEREHPGDWPLLVDSRRWEKDNFGRILGVLYRRSDGEQLNQSLIDTFGESVRYE